MIKMDEHTKFWKKNSSETVIRNITDLCSTKPSACAYNYSCTQLREKGSALSGAKDVDTSITEAQGRNKAWKVLPVAVIIIVVVTSQGCQASQADRIREKYLCACIHPHLETKKKKSRVVNKGQEGITFMRILTANSQRPLCRVIVSGKPFVSHNLQKIRCEINSPLPPSGMSKE